MADSCVKGCTVCAHTFARIMFYAQRQALNRPLFQHVSACYTHNSIVVLDTAWPWASEAYGLSLPFARILCAHKLIRARSYGLIVLQIVASMKHATKSIVALDTAWPWANDTYGLCCLRAYFCTRKLIRARSYIVIPQVGIAIADKNELGARAFERVSVLVLVLWSWALVL